MLAHPVPTMPRPPAPRPACLDSEGRHSAALFVQWVPYELAGTTWEAEEERYVRHLLSLLDRFAPGEPRRLPMAARHGCGMRPAAPPLPTQGPATAQDRAKHVQGGGP